MERDDFLWNADETKFHFNSHAHVERDVNPCRTCENLFDFNSHAHVERDSASMIAGIAVGISTHTLTWSVTMGINDHMHYSKFQLTRSRGA